MDFDALLKLRQEIEAKLVGKAWADPAFRAALLQDPTQTIQAFIASEGYVLPAELPSFTYRVVEETSPELILVLPSIPEDIRLSDEQLDSIAGGRHVHQGDCE